jgi:hypothetical protein
MPGKVPMTFVFTNSRGRRSSEEQRTCAKEKPMADLER